MMRESVFYQYSYLKSPKEIFLEVEIQRLGDNSHLITFLTFLSTIIKIPRTEYKKQKHLQYTEEKENLNEKKNKNLITYLEKRFQMF